MKLEPAHQVAGEVAPAHLDAVGVGLAMWLTGFDGLTDLHLAASMHTVRRRDDPSGVTTERIVDLRPRTILRILAIAIAVAVTLEVLWIARHVLAWVIISLFLALALNPFVNWIQRRSSLKRGPAIGVAYLVLLLAIAAIGASFVPKLVDEVNGFVQALPNYAHDLTHGRGRLGFLETKYYIVEKIRAQVKDGGATKVLGLSGAALSITKSIITIVAATVTIVFLTFFMLLEGPISWSAATGSSPSAHVTAGGGWATTSTGRSADT